MSSPLSVGDCIAIIGVITKGYNALSGSSDDAKELSWLMDDLPRMREILDQIQTSDQPQTSDSTPDLKILDPPVGRCKDALSELARVTKRYEPTNSRVKRYYRRLSFTLWGKKEIEPLQKRIQDLTAALTLAHAEVNRQVIEGLKAEVEQRASALSAQVEQGKEEVKLHIYAAIEEPFDHKPIRFQDASGRRFPVPLGICQRFKVSFPKVLRDDRDTDLPKDR
ncbi:hypothetical protein DL768_003331 [Monosporascus sp. mg162]|nr:hypothetical protein DL768_003331 [Monosporascus sp. mg162]